jgi:hypothetical protein
MLISPLGVDVISNPVRGHSIHDERDQLCFQGEIET